MAEAIIGMQQLQARLHAVGAAPAHAKILTAAAKSVVREQKLLASRFRKTSNLEHGIQIAGVTPTSVRVVSQAKYSGWVEDGTGVYGPTGQKITPKAAKALRWMGGTFGSGGSLRLTGSRRSGKAGAGAGYVFARSVRGRKATPFFKPGYVAGLAKAGAEMVVAVIRAWDDAA